MSDFLFVLEPTEGGAFASTAELCGAIARLGHRVEVLHQREPIAWSTRLYRRSTNLEVRARRPPLLEGLNRHWGRALRASPVAAPVPVLTAAVLENGFRRMLVAGARPNAVIASALSRVAWRRIRQDCSGYGIPLVFYLRGQTMLGHLELGARPDLVLVNSPALVEPVTRYGLDARYIPSAIDLDPYRVATRRQTVLVVNPLPAYGSELALAVAAAAPDVRFEFRESHTMSAEHRRHLEATIASLPNARLLPTTTDPAELYGNAALLMVPYPAGDLLTNRPRVVAEACAAGIPVVGSDIPGLRMSIGDGGVLLPPDDVSAWADELTALLGDHRRYDELRKRALARSEASDLSPRRIAQSFLDAVSAVVAS